MKQAIFTTDLFKGKTLPSTLSGHSIFKNPVQIRKIFPTLGLPNFKEEVNIDKCLIDIKKDGSYVFNLLRVISDGTSALSSGAAKYADNMRWLAPTSVRLNNKSKLASIYELSRLLMDLSSLTSPHNRDYLDDTIVSTNGRIELKLCKDILLLNGDVAFKKGTSIFKIYGKLKERCAEYNIELPPLDSMLEYKIFSQENRPNKKYQVVFSSNGEEGAWDIITMSMRGGNWRSCQSWDGEYPKCLIGSMVSRFIGVVYLTSGSPCEAFIGKDGNKNWGSLGTKMMHRSVVRYVYDRDANTPCILLDRMYPDKDNPSREVLKLFIDTIQSKCKLPVYYGPELGNKLKHIYLPNEILPPQISNREKSYQDAVLRSKYEFDMQLLVQNQQEVERYTSNFSRNLMVYLASKLEDQSIKSSNEEVKKTIDNIRNNTPFTPFTEQVIMHIMSVFKQPKSTNFYDSRSYYKHYLKEFFAQRKNIMVNSRALINISIRDNTSRDYHLDMMMDYIFAIIVAYTKSQIVNPIFNN